MRRHGTGNRFVHGLAAGLVAGLVSGLALMLTLRDVTDPGDASLIVKRLDTALGWASANLGLSLPVFAVVLALFGLSLASLHRRIRARRPLDEVAQADHLVDTWTSLFFGVGVIWTAIGMRGALLFALGDPQTSAQDGAFAVLQRMVDGGILVALSTTIFGGIGGYVMRIVKTMVAGAPLKRYYDAASRESADGIHDTLTAMENHLAILARAPTASEARRDEPAALG